MYNLHEIAYDTPGFVWEISTYPDLVCICGLQELIEDADKLLMLHNKLQLISYDQLGDFSVSPLIIKHTLFVEKPCMCMLHERKLTTTHLKMFRECVRKIPSLKKTTCPLVTDKEKAIIKAIKEEIPTIKLVFCWNHIFRDIRTWCHKHGAPSSDIAVYVADVQRLFHLPTADDYQKTLEELKKDWDAAFEEYYMQEIHCDVELSVGRWVLEKINVYNPYSGVTNNQSEGFNR